MNTLVWFLKYMVADVYKDVGGPNPDVGQTPAQKKLYNQLILIPCAGIAAAGAAAFFPWGGVPGAALFARKLWLLCTNTF